MRVLIEDLGPTPSVPPNLSIADVRPEGGILGAGVPVDIVVTVANHGSSPRAAERVALSIDGERLPSRRVDVPARDEIEVVFSVQFAQTGPHALVASLDGDRLAVDDTRSHVVDVPAPIRALIVNGARATRIEEDETGLLMAVLEPPDDGNLPGAGGLSPFDPREITPELLGSPDVDLFAYDVILLANVASPTFTDDVATRLEEAVAAGASLIVTAETASRPWASSPRTTASCSAPTARACCPPSSCATTRSLRAATATGASRTSTSSTRRCPSSATTLTART